MRLEIKRRETRGMKLYKRKETRDRRQEEAYKRKETRDGRQETGDKRQETGEKNWRRKTGVKRREHWTVDRETG